MLNRARPSSSRSSPPTRGCSVERHGRVAGGGVLPADAGVFRPRRRRGARREGPPRRRGGVPVQTQVYYRVATSSPPTRGCSSWPHHARCSISLLPADAGVFRRTRGCGIGGCSPPRRRGGVPKGWVVQDQEYRSSPPTRRCSARRARGSRPQDVLPADAGVFRASQGRARRPPPGPPRRRGGIPSRISAANLRAASFPPTQGCSDVTDHGVEGLAVFPADAGCSVLGDCIQLPRTRKKDSSTGLYSSSACTDPSTCLRTGVVGQRTLAASCTNP